MAYLSVKFSLNATITATTYGVPFDISPFASFSLMTDTTAFVGTYAPSLSADPADAAANNYAGGFTNFTAPSQHQDYNNPASAAHGNFKVLRLYCSAYTSGTPTFWLVGRYL